MTRSGGTGDSLSDSWETRLKAAGLWSRRLWVAGGAVCAQSILLVWVVARPQGIPSVVRPVVFGLSVVAATVIGLDVRASPGETAWWQPRRPAWALGAAAAGANVGLVSAYCLRRLEAAENTAPTEQWQRPAAASAILAGVGTAVAQSVVLPTPDVVGAVLLLATGNALGFALVGFYYDTRFVTGLLDDTGHGWLFRGYHWLVLAVVIVPANALFVVLYLHRRRTLVGRARRAQAGFGDLDSPDVDPPDSDR